jgi:hypothetical protein
MNEAGSEEIDEFLRLNPIEDEVASAPPPAPGELDDEKQKQKEIKGRDVGRGKEALKAEAKTLHHLMTHAPKNPYCEVCQRAKMYKTPSYRVDGSTTVDAEKFGDLITADHLVLHRDNEQEIDDARLALVVKDVATDFVFCYPSGRKTKDECYAALTHFTSRADEIGTFYSDNAPELESAATELGWRREKSKECLHQTNAVAERCIRAVTEGTRSNLEQAGLCHRYWPEASKHACMSYNVSHMGLNIRLGCVALGLNSEVLSSRLGVELTTGLGLKSRDATATGSPLPPNQEFSWVIISIPE